MEKRVESRLVPSARTLQIVTRTLRHEVGNLLQTIYSAIAILSSRLPPGAENEQRLLTELHTQAETCKFKLDAVQELTCPITVNLGPTNLTDLVVGLAARIGPRYPHVQVQVNAPRTMSLVADAQRLVHVGHLLLVNACQTATQEVNVTVSQDAAGLVEWTVTDDGPGANAEQLQWLTEPFTTTHFAQFGLGLALAQRIAELHGGAASAGNRPEGGFRIVLTLPAGLP